VERATKKAADLPAAENPREDLGATFIELLVALVLLGTTVIAVLVALQATTVASTTDADHARAFAWLHDASDSVYQTTRVTCNRYVGSGDPALLSNWASNVGDSDDTTANGTVWGVYNDAVDSTPAPNGWAGATISITKIEFLKPTSAESNTFEWGTTCFEGVIPDANGDGEPDDYRDTPLVSQKVTITVTAPDGSFTKTLETVKAQ
jgi:Tfp pilus assembly protein PilV